MKTETTKNKHMTLEDRIEIQECLQKQMTFKAIAQRIGKDQTTVSKEVKLHAKSYTNSFVKTDEVCPRLLKAPCVCNGCKLKPSSSCIYIRRMYTAKTAQQEYEQTLVESREGIALNKADFYEDDRIIAEQVKSGQHLYQIISFGLLLDNKTAAEAAAKILHLKEALKDSGYSFGDIFPVILSDNGGEFSDVASFECDSLGTQETRMFFCDPMQSSQKPFIEKNHTLFRDIMPKGSSFDNFTQDTVNLIFSHVNSVNRKKFNGKSPFDLFSFSYSDQLAAVFGISKVQADQVIQTTKLQKTADFIATLVHS